MVEPRCPYFGKCGGCSLQNIEYVYQLKDKKRALVDAARFGDVEVFSDVDYEYRNRMDFVFHRTGLGLREKGNWKSVVDVKTCVIAEPKINELLNEIRDYFREVDYFDVNKKTGTFRYAVIRTAIDSSISFVLNEDSSRLSQAIEKIKEFAEKTSADNVVVTYVPANTDVTVGSEFFVLKGEDNLHETHLGKKFSYSVQGFFQNNHKMAEKMQKYVHELLSKYETKKAHLLDLYGGVGTFGIMNSEIFKTTQTVEAVKECTDSANVNIENNDAKNVKAITLDAKNIRRLKLESPLFVITDPPRSGMDEKTIQHLNLIKPELIIYISCNVEQLRKDIPKLKNHEVKSAALFDLFPQTPHSEAVVELVLRKGDVGAEKSF